jgi:glycosyltransferase involved in cell wall biosynthesis
MNVGGTARYVGELVEKIPNSKIATGFVQGNEIEDTCIQKIDFIRVPHMGRKISPVNDLRAWIELRKVIKEVKPVIVHTHTFKAGLIGRLAGGRHKRVHTFHGHLFDDQSFSKLEKKIIIIAEKFLANRTNLLISVGKKVGVEIRAQGIGSNQDWLSIAPGVKALPVINKTQARKSLGLITEGVLFGWMARMAEVKNPLLLLEVASQLPEVNFVMAGGGNLFEDIKDEAPKNVTVIGWADASTFWSAVDCAISTSDNEGMSIALIEAQLAGLPVIATNVGSNAEVIQDGFTGIITSKSSNDIIDAIKNLLAGTGYIQTMGRMGRDRATEEFSLKKMLEMHKDAYKSLMKNFLLT